MFRPQIKFRTWNELPDLEVDEKSFIETWQETDVLFGPGCDGKTISGVMHYIKPAWQKIPNVDFYKGTYKGYFGEFVGYPTNRFLEGSGTLYHEYNVPYRPDLVSGARQISFKKKLEASRYSPLTQRCTGPNKYEALSRVSKSSKAFLEYCLFEPHINKIHFVLDDLNFELVIKENSENETHKQSESAKKVNKGNSYTSHELRLLHRLALLYPSLVQQKVICWYKGKKTQLPAKSHLLYTCWDRATNSYQEKELREFWKCYDPTLEKCQKNPMYLRAAREYELIEEKNDNGVVEEGNSRRFGSSKL